MNRKMKSKIPLLVTRDLMSSPSIIDTVDDHNVK